MNKFKANREDLDVLNVAYNFYDFLSSDVEVSIKTFHLMTEE